MRGPSFKVLPPSIWILFSINWPFDFKAHILDCYFLGFSGRQCILKTWLRRILGLFNVPQLSRINIFIVYLLYALYNIKIFIGRFLLNSYYNFILVHYPLYRCWTIYQKSYSQPRVTLSWLWMSLLHNWATCLEENKGLSSYISPKTVLQNSLCSLSLFHYFSSLFSLLNISLPHHYFCKYPQQEWLDISI